MALWFQILQSLTFRFSGKLVTFQSRKYLGYGVTITETPYLILGADNHIYKQNLIDIISLPDKLHETSSDYITITGIGVHIKKQHLLVSDSTGKVDLVPLGSDKLDRKTDLYPSLLKPTTITIDWLNDTAFIISRNRIYSCPLYKENDQCVVVIDGLDTPPTDVKVDPLNGYLYYCDGRGIFRLDLADVGTGELSSQTQMVYDDSIKSFALDFSKMQLYYPNETQNTMMSVYFDRSEVNNIRPPSESSRFNFSNMFSIATYQGLFYWTTRNDVKREEFDKRYDIFRQNNFLFFNDKYSNINIYHPTTQPEPVPYTPPTDIQALFNSHSAQISWKSPSKLEYQGRGAWNQWSYEIEIFYEIKKGKTKRLAHKVSETTLSVNRLHPDTQYSIQLRAVSNTGQGPWSQFFVGRTLKYEPIPVKVYLALKREILEHDLSEYKVESLRHVVSPITDISWYNNHVMWTNSDGKLLLYNKQTRQQSVNNHAQFATCLTFDWLGQKIFWSEPDRNTLVKIQSGLWVNSVIRRSDLNGIVSESIYQTSARDMTIDSIAGRLYWATTNTIESTYLNGDDPTQIFMVEFFSGYHVISLALNFDLQKVIWFVKSFESQDLYMADLVGLNGANSKLSSTTAKKYGDFRSISKSSGLQYYSNHLFWLDQTESVVVGDHEGNYSSVISPANHYISSFAVSHPSLHRYPGGMNASTTVVIPNPMSASDLSVVGNWSKFNLTWRPSAEVNHGEVLYKLYIQIRHYAKHIITKDTAHTIEGYSPYTQMTVTIQPYTYWGYADSVTIPLRSPMSVPEAPLTPRVYVTQHKNATTAQQSLAADFRWSTPGIINGILQYHNVFYWERDQMDVKSIRVPGTARHFIMNPLAPNKTYFFKVEACTEVGCGPSSDIVSAKTDAVNPVPKLLIATKTAVRISEMDDHLNSTVMLPSVSPSAMAFLAQDDRTFWIERSNSLFVSKEATQIPLMQLNNSVKDMTMDWVSRTLYIVEEGKGGESDRIMGYHVDQQKYQLVINRNTTIGSVLSDPYTSSLFWTEIDKNGKGQLFQSNINGTNVEAILGNTGAGERRKRSCNCEDDINVSPLISMDYTDDGSTEIVIVDMKRRSIIATDVHGCVCREIYKASNSQDNGLPPDLIAIDHMRVYWYNTRDEKLYSIYKESGTGYIELNQPDINDMVAYGAHLQPLPDSICLDPGAYNGSVTGIKITNSSVTLQLEEVKRPTACHGISLPIDKFTIYYRKQDSPTDGTSPLPDCSNDPDSCQSVESYKKEVTIERLDVYSDYIFQVAVSNYYTEYLSEALGKRFQYSTLHGAPSEARNVSAGPLSFQEVRVNWLPPLKANGPKDGISCIVAWSTVTDDGVHLKGQTKPGSVRKDRKTRFLYSVVSELLANQTYNVKVLCYDYEGKQYSESEVVSVTTCELPNDIVLKNVTPSSILINWTSPSDKCVTRHNILYEQIIINGDGMTEIIPGEYYLPKTTSTNTSYKLLAEGLEPFTKYRFFILLSYRFAPISVIQWPIGDKFRFMFQTLSDIPGEPLPPIINEVKEGSHDVEWQAPVDHGAPIELYKLESSESDMEGWEVVYNGSKERWNMDYEMFVPGVQYIFRVTAKNSNGWGPTSLNSSTFVAPSIAASSSDEEFTIIVAVSVAVILLFIIIVVAIIICLVMRRRQLEKAKKPRPFVIRGPDVELATLRELPLTAVQQSNTLYAFSIVPTDEDIAALPYLRRDQLVLTRFLGSGAFGEVFEGVAKYLNDAVGDTRVAVKTLRKNSSDQEKDEFLKEAVLMSNFKHDHILSLLGVCLDNDPQFIIMELMEGGDLLSYLRCCRATISSPPRLYLPDLVRVCVNVASGCEYLEGMHFVHRDLAARNCLVSSKNPSDMVVKIGDFGLARDIYKNDYYRKEGEGLLPVRWMSPESLVDGVFTTHSDIWAFGVLMWEVITLGQQPYPARTNVEVLQFVRSGGKLDKPDKCPDEIYSLMENCWSFDAHNRPSFASISLKLKQIQEQCGEMSPEQILQSSPQTLDGGGSVRLTPTSKKKRLRSLMGLVEETHEKAVDLSSRQRMKRTVSYDSSQPTYTQIAQDPYTADLLDHLGYLNPRAKTSDQYLKLLNQAPELEKYGLSSHQTAHSVQTEIPLPYHQITSQPDSQRSRNPSSSSSNPPPYSSVRNTTNGTPIPTPRQSLSSNKSRSPRPSTGSDETPYYHTNYNRETSEQDNEHYLRPVISRQSSESPPHSPATCVDCSTSSPCIECSTDAPCIECSTSTSCVDCTTSSPCVDNKNILYSRIKDKNHSNNNSEKSVKDNSDYINYHGGRSRAQVFPEPGSVLAGFEVSQASLV
ncbi:hypothetical protein LOTGIDRAFT_156686 [Lottia gigantea]|uniref:Tyrosine-protein kinase receptor n=1 Tax=Lottia gigantea TaxID=225164 RepID=V4CNU0_LOTGI|nr:hypothetical protein LOTGIDRAFT_156686 [Lottia gigantea]ESP04075.1 hypothetical protein LOTGIDRAFT_156686 [Lottia gigantea]